MRQVVSTLEFHLEELHRTRKIGNEKGLVNQYGIHNALVALRTKCGVRFDPNEYDHSLHIAEVLRRQPPHRRSSGSMRSGRSASSSGCRACAT